MIEGYRFVRMLGRGGMGVVWEAIQLGTARGVAVKFMGAALLNEGARRRFSREVKLAARLTHPHIVRIYDSGLHQNAYYYAMELVHGVPLDDAIQADNACFKAARRPGVTLAIHLCRGNNRSHWYAEGGYDAIAEKMFATLDVDRFLLEYDDARSGTPGQLRGFEAIMKGSCLASMPSIPASNTGGMSPDMLPGARQRAGKRGKWWASAAGPRGRAGLDLSPAS